MSREKFLDSLICEEIEVCQHLPPDLLEIVHQLDDSFTMSNESVAETFQNNDVFGKSS